MASGARLACESGREGRRSRGETAAGGHAPRVALDVGGGMYVLSVLTRGETVDGRAYVLQEPVGPDDLAPGLSGRLSFGGAAVRVVALAPTMAASTRADTPSAGDAWSLMIATELGWPGIIRTF